MNKLSSNERIIAWRLATGRRITIYELIGALFHPNNEPGNPHINIVSHVMRLRKKSPITIHPKPLKGGRRNFQGYYIDHNDLEKFRDWLVEDIKNTRTNTYYLKYKFHGVNI